MVVGKAQRLGLDVVPGKQQIDAAVWVGQVGKIAS